MNIYMGILNRDRRSKIFMKNIHEFALHRPINTIKICNNFYNEGINTSFTYT